MESLLYFLILVIIFAAVAWGAFWICDKAGFPPPVKWIVGLLLLLILLFFAVRTFSGDGDGRFNSFPRGGSINVR